MPRDVFVEVAFASPANTVKPWYVDITDKVKSISTKSGRSYELDRFEAGTLSLELDNQDGRFTPGRGSAAPEVTRTNYVTNPRFAVDATGIVTQTGAGVRVADSRGSGFVWRHTPSASNSIMATLDIPVPAAMAGQPVLFMIDARSLSTSPRYMGIDFDWRKADGTATTYVTNAVRTTEGAGWQTLSVETTVPALGATLRLRFNHSSTLNGGPVHEFTKIALIGGGDTQSRVYFDGATTFSPLGDDYSYAWTGTANASTSTETVTGYTAGPYFPNVRPRRWVQVWSPTTGINLLTSEYVRNDQPKPLDIWQPDSGWATVNRNDGTFFRATPSNIELNDYDTANNIFGNTQNYVLSIPQTVGPSTAVAGTYPYVIAETAAMSGIGALGSTTCGQFTVISSNTSDNAPNIGIRIRYYKIDGQSKTLVSESVTNTPTSYASSISAGLNVPADATHVSLAVVVTAALTASYSIAAPILYKGPFGTTKTFVPTDHRRTLFTGLIEKWPYEINGDSTITQVEASESLSLATATVRAPYEQAMIDLRGGIYWPLNEPAGATEVNTLNAGIPGIEYATPKGYLVTSTGGAGSLGASSVLRDAKPQRWGDTLYGSTDYGPLPLDGESEAAFEITTADGTSIGAVLRFDYSFIRGASGTGFPVTFWYNPGTQNVRKTLYVEYDKDKRVMREIWYNPDFAVGGTIRGQYRKTDGTYRSVTFGTALFDESVFIEWLRESDGSGGIREVFRLHRPNLGTCDRTTLGSSHLDYDGDTRIEMVTLGGAHNGAVSGKGRFSHLTLGSYFANFGSGDNQTVSQRYALSNWAARLLVAAGVPRGRLLYYAGNDVGAGVNSGSSSVYFQEQAAIDKVGASIDWPDNVSGAEQAQTWLNGTLGALYCDSAGNIVLEHRIQRTSRAPDLIIGERFGTAPEFPLSIEMDYARIVNEAKVSNPVGSSTYRNPDSVTEYGLRQSEGVTEAGDPLKVEGFAQWLVNRYSDPRNRLDAVNFNVSAGDNIGLLAVNLRVGQKIRLVDLPSSAPSRTMDFFVESIGHDISVSGQTPDWKMALGLSPVNGFDVWVLESSTYGMIDDAVCNLSP